MSKTKVLFFFIAMVFAAKANAQKIYMYKTFGGVAYLLNDSVQLSNRQTGSLLYQNQKAYTEFKKARTWSTCSAVSGFLGGAMVAIPLATLAFGEKSDVGYAVGGSVLMGGSFVMHWIYKARALNAIDIYNEGLPQKTSRIKPQFQFYGTGAKLVIKF